MTAATQYASGDAGLPRLALWLFDCDRHAEQLMRLEHVQSVLPECERRRVARFPNELQRQRWVCARVALRRVLGISAGSIFETRPFDVTAQGRPFLAAPAPQFSISHAGAYALVAVSDDAAIGADIEQIALRKISPQRRLRLEAFAGRLCAEPLPDDEAARFIQAWCRIEAAAKADGCGVGRLLTRAGLMGSGGKSAGPDETCIVANGPATCMCAEDLLVGDLAPGFAAAIAGPQTAMVTWQSSGALRVLDGSSLLVPGF